MFDIDWIKRYKEKSIDMHEIRNYFKVLYELWERVVERERKEMLRQDLQELVLIMMVELEKLDCDNLFDFYALIQSAIEYGRETDTVREKLVELFEVDGEVEETDFLNDVFERIQFHLVK
jgi:hypothetical protein